MNQTSIPVFCLLSLIPPPSDVNTRNFQNLKNCFCQAGIPTSRILQRGDPGYDDLNIQHNTRYGQIYPGAYFEPESAKHVQIAVRCATKSRVRIVAKTTGHGYTKYAYGDETSLIVFVHRMKRITVKDDIATVDPGLTDGQVSYRLHQEAGSMLPFGVCPTVGVSGVSLGGGHGFFTSSYGTMADNILELKMVDAKGQLLTVNNRTNPDLYWALRGGGCGSYGIVTKFKFQVHKSPAAVVYTIIYYDFKQFPLVFKAWQDLFDRNPPRSLGSIWEAQIQNTTAMRLTFVDILNGDEVDSIGTSRTDKILESFPPSYNTSMEVVSWPEFLLKAAPVPDTDLFEANVKFTNISDLYTLDYNGSLYYKAKSFYVDKKLDKNGIAELMSIYSEVVGQFRILYKPYAGAIRNVPSDATAFVHRDVLYNVQLSYQQWTPDPKIEEGMIRVFSQTKKLLNHKHSYQNYVDDDPDMADFLERYYGANLPRLVEVKKKYDPDNVFHHPQSIPVKLDK